MIEATQLRASLVINAPENRQVRDTLPKLASAERIVQLCNIEGLEQLRLLAPEEQADSLAPSAFAETVIKGHALDAPGGAYRSHRRWFSVRFNCTVAPDFGSVTAFHFAVGDEIPQSEWDSHDLVAADEDE